MTFGYDFNGSVYISSSSETIDYDYKDIEEVKLNIGLPKYFNTSSKQNTCANVAGAIVLGYYDRVFDELIPNFKSTRVIKDKIIYNVQTSAVQNVIDYLYELMNTNHQGGGTTITGFLNGFENYVTKIGHSILYNSVIVNSNISNISCTTTLKDNIPIVLFVSNYTLIPLGSFNNSSNRDTLNMMHYNGNHVLVCYGLSTVRYYDSNSNVINTKNLMLVATGYSNDNLAYLALDGFTGLIDGYGIDIL